MAFWEHYSLPTTVDDALRLLAHEAGAARVVAGGTDLLLDLQQGREPPVARLVDVTRIPEMTAITRQDEFVFVGAAVTHARLVQEPLLARAATCLVESCAVIGGPQVRNVATLGGNVAHALPAGDGTLSLVALEAEAEVATWDGAAGQRAWRPIRALFAGPGHSGVDQTRELIVRFRFRAPEPREATAYKRIMRPQGVALPILALAVWVRLEAAGERIAAARLALGPAGPTPLRAERAEAFLAGRPALAEAIHGVVPLLWTSPHRASAEYRRELVAALVERALSLAVRRAQTGAVVPELAEEA
jgi:carbon-monoxide dehydrogenase medium subunit